MFEYQSFVYLDVQKTGSSYVRRLLHDFCEEKPLRGGHHHRIPADIDRGKFFFISTRDPVACYASLYAYGRAGSGKVRKRMERLGNEELYYNKDDFGRWLEFVLDRKNARNLREGYSRPETQRLRKHIGFFSYRHLLLSAPDPIETFGGCATKAELKEAFEEKRLFTHVVHQESLAEDLKALVKGPLAGAFGARIDDALEFLDRDEKVNASSSSDKPDKAQLKSNRKIVRRREWLAYDIWSAGKAEEAPAPVEQAAA